MPPTSTPTNGAAIRAIRERTGLSVRDMVRGLAELGIEVHEDHLRNVENDRRNAGPQLVKGIAEVLAVPQTAILGSVAIASVSK
ncbi:helix-turn-helix domain-containing protein [Lentzea albidocapillata]|nr:helix-turn-helix transcriptional regulator [Lentzea albidocapillata]